MKIIIHSPPLILFHVNALLTALSALAVISLPTTTCTVFLRLQHTLKSVFSPFTSYSKRHSSIFLDYRVLDITFLAFTHTQTRLVVQKLQVYTRDLIFFWAAAFLWIEREPGQPKQRYERTAWQQKKMFLMKVMVSSGFSSPAGALGPIGSPL